MKYLPILLLLMPLSSADAAWRVGPRASVQFRLGQRPAARVVQRPHFASPIQQSGGCRMINGRMVCPNSGSVRGLLRVR